MTRVCVELEGELHKAVRKKAIDEGISMKEFIVEALLKEVELELARREKNREKGEER